MSRPRENNATRGARRRAQTSGAILAAADEIFGKTAYPQVRLEDVAEAADVSVGAIYSHFKTKDGLYQAVVERAAEHCALRLRQALETERPPLERVMAAGDAFLGFHAEHPGALRLLTSPELRSSGLDPERQARITAGMSAIVDQLSATIQTAIDAGDARPVDARLAAHFLWAAWSATIGLSLRRDGLGLSIAETEQALAQAHQIVVAGLRASG